MYAFFFFLAYTILKHCLIYSMKKVCTLTKWYMLLCLWTLYICNVQFAKVNVLKINKLLKLVKCLFLEENYHNGYFY